MESVEFLKEGKEYTVKGFLVSTIVVRVLEVTNDTVLLAGYHKPISKQKLKFYEVGNAD